MARLSSPIHLIQATYDVVVVGSGYGGAISASRLARAGRSVCLLERGLEREPGEYPETPIQAFSEMQVDAPEGHIGPATGLFDFRVNPDVSVIVGCGLGGTSLINANVALRPDPRVFQDGRWPAAIARDEHVLDIGYRLSKEMLRPVPYPDTFPRLPKMEAQARSAKALGARLTLTPINVTFEDGPSPAGVPQKACVLCGNCVSGCNHRAKNTVLMNYLPDAKNHGAEIYCGVKVLHVEKVGADWVVHYELLEGAAPGAPPMFVRARVVVLAAGALGSTEILLRSRDMGLPVSDQLGAHFSGNGDMLAFAYDTTSDVNGIGWPGSTPPGGPPVGPTITSAIDLRGRASVEQDVLVEEGAIPAGLAPFFTLSMAALAEVKKLAGEGGPTHPRSIAEAAAATQTYLVMSLDDDEGRVVLRDGRARVDWPEAGREPDLRLGNEDSKKAAEAIGGDYLISPLWSRIAGKRLLTAHPLGGCAMGDDAARGAVDDRCRVFSGKQGTAVHEGLHVCDGSVVPSPLGVNPLWTISALTERACHYLALERGWPIDYTLPRAAPAPAAPAGPKVGIRFEEALSGFFAAGVTDDYERGHREGEATGSSLALRANIESDDLDDMLENPAHEARLIGTVVAPALSPEPLTVTNGIYNLFTEDPSKPGFRFMRYRMSLTTEAGRTYFLDGLKHIGNDPITRAWHDSTTLYTTIHDGPDERAPVLGQGILRIGVAGVVDLLASMQAVNEHGLFQRAAAVLRYMRFFLGAEAETYLGGWRPW